MPQGMNPRLYQTQRMPWCPHPVPSGRGNNYKLHLHPAFGWPNFRVHSLRVASSGHVVPLPLQ